jgi:hypothetical protein
MQVGAAGPDFGSAPGPSRYPRVSSPINDQSVLGGNDECVQCPRQRGPLRGQPGQQVPVDPSARPCWYAYWACQPRARRAASGAPSIPGGPGSWRCCGNLRRWPWSPAHFRSPRWCRPAGRSARWAAGSDCDCGTGATARNAADQGLRQVVGLGLRQVVLNPTDRHEAAGRLRQSGCPRRLLSRPRAECSEVGPSPLSAARLQRRPSPVGPSRPAPGEWAHPSVGGCDGDR